MAKAGAVWLPVLPDMSGWNAEVRSGLAGTKGVELGQQLGRDYSRGVKAGLATMKAAVAAEAQQSADAAAKAVEAASTKVEAASTRVAAARRKVADAVGAVEVAEKKLAEVTAKEASSESARAAAAERVAKARRRQEAAVESLASAEKGLGRASTALGRAEDTSNRAVTRAGSTISGMPARLARMKSAMMSAAASGIDSAERLKGSWSRAGVVIGGLARRAAGGVLAVAGAGAALGIKVAASAENADIAFTTMLGSGTKARAFLVGLQKFAATTPFEFPELQTASQSLISAGVNAGKIIPIMTTLGNVTAGMGTGAEGVQRATVALQQMIAAQKISGEDLNQLRDAGIPVYDLLAKALGKTKGEVVDLASKGKLGKDALDKMMGALETGRGLERFSGLMDKQSRSLSGMWSTFKDTLGLGLAKAVEPALPALKRLLDWGSKVSASGLARLPRLFESAKHSVTAFAAAWRYNDGQVSSSGFNGYLERAGYWLHQVWTATAKVVGWGIKHRDILIPIVAGIGAMVAAMKLWRMATTALAVGQALLNAVMSANPIGVIILAVIGLGTALVVLYRRNETFRRIVQAVWAAVRKAVGSVVDWILDTAWPALKKVLKAIAKTFTWLWEKGVRPALRFIIGGFLDLVGGIIDGAAKAFGWVPKLGPKLKSAAADFHRFKDNVNSALSGVSDRKVNIGIQFKAGTKLYYDAAHQGIATGGYVQILASGKPRRYADGGTMPGYTPGRDVHHFYSPTAGWLSLSGGEPVLRPEAGAELGRGWVDGINAAARTGGRGGVRRFLGGYAGGGLLPKTFTPSRGVVTRAVDEQTLASTASVARSLIGSYAAPQMSVGSGAGRWAAIALQAMAMAGLPASYLSLLLYRLGVESGGNPLAINLWDSNAAAGTPSKGLMQVIDPTFNAYAGPLRPLGVWNPLANIYAAIRYSLSRYGLSGIPRAWGGHAGYRDGGVIDPPFVMDAGGVLAPGVNIVDNKLGKPEPLARTDQPMDLTDRTIDRLADRLAARMPTRRDMAAAAAHGSRYYREA